MKKRFQFALLGMTLLCLAGFPVASSATAQSGQRIVISAPDVSQYPEITVYIDPTGRDGKPLSGLTGDQITLTEDGIRRDVIEFEELQPGIQLVAAFNLSDPFAIQDINGRSRFDFIKETLLNWGAQPLQTAPDDLSLVANNGLEATHLQERPEWVAALEDFSPDLDETESDFSVLSRAIEIASDPLDQPGMKRIVLFFSPQPTSGNYPAIDSLTAQAVDNGVIVYPILVSSPAFFETEGAARLSTLAQQTGGTLLTFSGEEPLADPGLLLEPFRSTYLIRYLSSIVTSGTHTLEVSLTDTPATIVGSREFILDIQPPNPILISPPRMITRVEGDRDPEEDQQVTFQPDAVELPILVEFPDGLPRELEELIFRVDGEVVSRLTEPPYQEITWDLTGYQSSGTHYLTLEAVDIMGLTRMSLATPVEIVIELSPQTLGTIIRRNLPAFLGLGFILLLGLTLFALISRGAIRPQMQGRTTGNLSRERLQSLLMGVFPWKGKSQAEPPAHTGPAYRLIPISDSSRDLFPEPIAVHQMEIILGNTPGENTILINHPSVIAQHARLTIREDERFQIDDFGSTAGTWINYQQIPAAKSQFLRDGDIIHIGEAAFRFQIIPKLEGPSPIEEINS